MTPGAAPGALPAEPVLPGVLLPLAPFPPLPAFVVAKFCMVLAPPALPACGVVEEGKLPPPPTEKG